MERPCREKTRRDSLDHVQGHVKIPHEEATCAEATWRGHAGGGNYLTRD